MHTTVLQTDGDDAWRDLALDVLRAGGVVAAATETVYGLAGDATRDNAVAAIYAAKGRPSHNPLIAHVADTAMAQRVADLSPIARTLIGQFWPGPLTLVLPLRSGHGLAPAVTAGGDSVALRCPQGTLGALTRALGRPLAAPSANRSGHISPTTAKHVVDDLGGRIPLIVDSGPTQAGLESTIVDARGETPALLRPGAVTQDALEAALGTPIRTADHDPAQPVAPGQLESHYAPGVPVRLNVQPGDLRDGEAYLGFGEHHIAGHLTLSASGDLAEAGTQLFALLRRADGANPAAIAIAPIPDTGLGAAINDRLKRAAAPRPKG